LKTRIADKPRAAPFHPSIAAFLDMMLAERNAAANTRAAYARDLGDAASFLARKKISLPDAGEDDLRDYMRDGYRRCASSIAFSVQTKRAPKTPRAPSTRRNWAVHCPNI
jgi:site-specific recombinase XerD